MIEEKMDRMIALLEEVSRKLVLANANVEPCTSCAGAGAGISKAYYNKFHGWLPEQRWSCQQCNGTGFTWITKEAHA